MLDVLLLVLLVSQSATRFETQEAPSLLSDTRLKERIALRLRFATVRDVLGTVSRRTGVSLKSKSDYVGMKNVFVLVNH
jgi:hypothetical protein